LVYRAEFTALLDRIGVALTRLAPAIAVAGALSLAAYGIAFGSFAVGGADSYGYVNQAYDWVSGRLPKPIPLTVTLPFEFSDPMQVPLGYRVGQQPHTMVPTYAPGLPLLMALSLAAGACGPFFVVPIFGALFVWLTFKLGTRAGGRAVGVVAVLMLVTCPVVLYQALWPMSDVPAGTLWTGAVLYALGESRRSALAAGLFAAVGLLVRPNLLLVLAAPLISVLASARGRERWTRAMLFCAPIVPVAMFVAALNTLWYGSPSNSGYGAARDIYLLSNVWPNIRLNASWLWESQRAWLFFALLPFVPPFRPGLDRRALSACTLVCLATFASYASYSQFEVWWYLRFLMPAFGAFAVLTASGVTAIARALPQPFGRVAAAAALCLVVVTTVSFAADKGVFGGLRAGERRYIDIGEFADEQLPANAVLFSVQHSGSLRFYSGRLTLRFDWVQKDWAAAVPAAVEAAGYHPYLIVDDWEIPQVRVQFGFAENSPLPWPIVARMRELGGLTIFDMATKAVPSDPVALQPGSGHWRTKRRNPAI
jgi:hypothetical protein